MCSILTISSALILVLDVTLAQVCLRLAEEDKKRVEEGQSVAHDVSPGAFLSLGMDIQGQQYVCSYLRPFMLLT